MLIGKENNNCMSGKVYELVKEYPGSPKLGAKVIGGDIGTCPYNAYRGEFPHTSTFAKCIIENFPEYWQPAKVNNESTISN